MIAQDTARYSQAMQWLTYLIANIQGRVHQYCRHRRRMSDAQDTRLSLKSAATHHPQVDGTRKSGPIGARLRSAGHTQDWLAAGPMHRTLGSVAPMRQWTVECPKCRIDAGRHVEHAESAPQAIAALHARGGRMSYNGTADKRIRISPLVQLTEKTRYLA